MNFEQFHQQPDDVRQHVLDKSRDWNVDAGWAEFIIEQFKEHISGYGIEPKCVNWSGFWSQGDGACFDGHTSDMVHLCNTAEELKPFADVYQLDQISMSWISRGNYSHEHTLSFEMQDHRYVDENEDDIGKLRDKLVQIETKRLRPLEEAIIEWVKDQCRKLYNDLEEEYEHLTSDEQVLESLEANDQLEEDVLQAREELGYEF